VSFERLSIRLPDRFRVPSGPIGFEHGGQLWKSNDVEVRIEKFLGISLEPFTLSQKRQCTTFLGGRFALIREDASERVQGVSALFPDLGLSLDARSPRTRDLALLRTIIESARPATEVVR
jgi:hypothetical protein